jgi:hypothetical protein
MFITNLLREKKSFTKHCKTLQKVEIKSCLKFKP